MGEGGGGTRVRRVPVSGRRDVAMLSIEACEVM